MKWKKRNGEQNNLSKLKNGRAKKKNPKRIYNNFFTKMWIINCRVSTLVTEPN